MQGGTSAGARSKTLPVTVADDRGTFRSTVADRIGEVDALQELLHLLVQGSTADDDLVHAATESVQHFLTDHLAHLLRDHGHLQQQTHAVVLDLGEDLFADDLLDDQRHGNHDDRPYLLQGSSDDGRRGDAVQIVDVTAVQELEEELEGHTVHVGHRKHRDDRVTGLDLRSQHVAGEVVVRPQCTIGQHHAFREARCAAGVIDHSQLVGTLLHVIAYVLLAEVLGELLTVELVQVLAGIGQLVGARHHQRVVGVVDDTLERRHRLRIDDGGHMVADEEQAGLRVVHDVVDLFRIKLVQDGHGDGAVGQCGDEGHSPL